MIYLDANATTRVLPEVFESMKPFLCEQWGNPSSSYSFGSKLRRPIESARDSVASLLNAQPREIVFTSCGTESNNTAICAALSLFPKKKHIVTSSVEHSSVISHTKQLEQRGYRVTYLGVNEDGTLKLEALQDSITDDTAIVSLMWANNETGVVFPIYEISKICRQKNVIFHTDAAQAIGKLRIDLSKLDIDFLSFTGHKIHAPKGIGVLYVNRKQKLIPYIVGGHQEKGRRGGTENVANIAGLGMAAQLTASHLGSYGKLALLRDKLESEILSLIPDTRVNGNRKLRLPNTSNITFSGIESEALLIMLDQQSICASAGSACLADSNEPSHVLSAMGRSSEEARSMVRFSFDYDVTFEDICIVVKKLSTAVKQLRAFQDI